MRSNSASMAGFEIDYIKKTIGMKIKHTPKSELKKICQIYFNHFVVMIWILLVFAFTPIVAYLSFNSYVVEDLFFMIGYLMVITIISTGFMLLYHYINPKYADKYFAKVMALVHITEQKTFKFKNIRSKDFIIAPLRFNNMKMEYKTYGNIDLSYINIYKLDPDKKDKAMLRNWGIHFRFKKIPKGWMSLKII